MRCARAGHDVRDLTGELARAATRRARRWSTGWTRSSSSAATAWCTWARTWWRGPTCRSASWRPAAGTTSPGPSACPGTTCRGGRGARGRPGDGRPRRRRGARRDRPGTAPAVVPGVLSAGFDAAVNARANTMTWPRGTARYVRAVLAELAPVPALRLPRSRWTTRPGSRRARWWRWRTRRPIGGGMRIAPDAAVDDGLLDVVIAGPLSRARPARPVPAGLPRHPRATTPRARWCGARRRAHRAEPRGPGAAGRPSPTASGSGRCRCRPRCGPGRCGCSPDGRRRLGTARRRA